MRTGYALFSCFLLISLITLTRALSCVQAPGLLQWKVAGNCTIDLPAAANVKFDSLTLKGERAGRLPVVYLKGKGAVQGLAAF